MSYLLCTDETLSNINHSLLQSLHLNRLLESYRAFDGFIRNFPIFRYFKLYDHKLTLFEHNFKDYSCFKGNLDVCIKNMGH